MVHPHAIVGILRRLVQLDGAATAEDGHLAEDDPQQQDSTSESTLGLRVLAIFMILAAGLLGALPPLFLRVGLLLCAWAQHAPRKPCMHATALELG